jgi:hypothetical protein
MNFLLLLLLYFISGKETGNGNSYYRWRETEDPGPTLSLSISMYVAHSNRGIKLSPRN